MPDRRAQRKAKRRAHRAQVVAGMRARKQSVRRITDEVAALGPEVAEALEAFRQHDTSPDVVRSCLRGPAPWVFTFDDDVDLVLGQEARDMLLALMSG